MNENTGDLMQALRQRAAAVAFPEGMFIGAATAAYQIEGAADAAGRGASIWDVFAERPGAVADGANGAIACDHCNRFQEDIHLMASLNLNAYRFSISWPRILPRGRGSINEKGLDFYSRLVDQLHEIGVTPFATLYHWDLPQALQEEAGGWLRRGVVDDFREYAGLVSSRLGDRIKHWATINEPWTFCWWGYGIGSEAPGVAGGAAGALAAVHHALLSHGEAMQVVRENSPGAKVGIVLDLNPVTPATPSAADIAAARRFDGCQNRWFLDPLFNGSYPADMVELFGPESVPVRAGDLEVIARAMDFLGVNVYRRSVISDGSDFPPVNFTRARPPGRYTTMGWEVRPTSLFDILDRVNREYAPKEIHITENGAAFRDVIGPDGRVCDTERAEYLVEHVEQAAKVVAAGIPLKGYFAWTLMDNFEWAEGYRQRFGLVHVDFDTRIRAIKESGRIFSLIARNARSAA